MAFGGFGAVGLAVGAIGIGISANGLAIGELIGPACVWCLDGRYIPLPGQWRDPFVFAVIRSARLMVEMRRGWVHAAQLALGRIAENKLDWLCTFPLPVSRSNGQL